MEITFGDNVRIKADPATTNLGIAGLAGQVYGETTPSVTEVEVIGSQRAHRALNVNIASLSRTFWIAPHLLELVDHAPGTEITVDGVPKKWVRSNTGEWIESNVPNS
jgi:hypothetical protein